LIKITEPLPEAAKTLETALHETSPRWTLPPTPAASILIHGTVLLLWAILFAQAFIGAGFAGWSVGIVYIFYDTVLLAFTFWQTWPLRQVAIPMPAAPKPAEAVLPPVTIIIAAYNEAAVLESTIAALMRQSSPPDVILIADDGSTDATAALLETNYGLQAATGGISAASASASASVPQLRWLRLPHAGKAAALNRALDHVTTELFITVDADTKLAAEAIAAMQSAFAAQPGLVAATGVLTPACPPDLVGRCFEWFQTYEYVRNFLSRYAWGRMDALLLISGAFAGFRLDAVKTVGGFDPDCLVEDYELIHRLRRYGYLHGLNWHSAAIGGARALTSAPGTMLGFLKQRRRWFGGFLQTQFWYRDMVGNPEYRKLGIWMLTVKAADTLQPVYGLCAFALLLFYIFTGKAALLIPVGGFIIGKITLDLAFHAWSIRLYRNWAEPAGSRTKISFGPALLAAIIEPFSFQLLRHLGACWGWVRFLTGSKSWS
jgi:cellulose synthase/poly-beta-1,6-N-acetylglucosamine synthase-like glycosyltransferase